MNGQDEDNLNTKVEQNIEYLAAIELGSHEVILEIMEAGPGGKLKEIESLSRTINLGSDSYRLGYITNDNVQLLLSTLRDFRKKLDVYPDVKIRLACTSAIREASNKMFILDQVRNQCRLDLEILSNREELSGMIRAVRHKMSDFNDKTLQPTLLLDIGAGSTQLTLFDEGKFVFTQNILLGSLRVRDRLAVLEQHTLDFKALMREYISGDLDYYRSFVPVKKAYSNFVLVGNLISTWRSLANLEMEGTVVLSLECFNSLFDQVTNSSTLQLMENFEISEEQASILLPMSMLIKEVFEMTGLTEVVLPDASLADGLLVELAEKQGIVARDLRSEEDAENFAREIAKRHYTNRDHVMQVEKLALLLFDQLQVQHGLLPRHRFILKIAAIMHNIGKFFNVKQDGDIAYQLIKSSELVGLSETEIEILALLVKYHSEKLENILMCDLRLSSEDQLVLIKLIIILALANSLDTGHRLKVRGLRTEQTKKHITVFLESDQDLTLESWSVQRPAAYYKEVFGKELRFIIQDNRGAFLG